MKYWVYMNGAVPGSYSPQELSALPGFSMATLVCPAEGEILEKNWRRSAEFDEITKVLHERAAKEPPSAPGAELLGSGEVNALLDTASTRLFTHVSELMKELESRREERALTLTLQKQLAAALEEIQLLREKTGSLEAKLQRLGEVEDALGKEQGRTQKLEEALKAREEGMAELRLQLEKSRGEHEHAKRRVGEAQNDLAIRNRLVDKLSRDLTEKEVSLAKALGLIRRLEEDLNRIVPPPPSEQAEVAVPLSPSARPKDAPPPVPSAPAAPGETPPVSTQAHSALGSFFKRIIPNKLDS